MSQELQESTIDRINGSYASFCDCYKQSEQIQIEGANHAREVGILLSEFKSKCAHGEFTQSFASFQGKLMPGNKFRFSYEHGSLMMRIAARYPDTFTTENFPERIRSLKDLLYATNQLQMPIGHGEQTLHQPNFFSFVAKYLTNFNAEWEKQLSRRPLEEWDQPEVEQFVAQLEPVVENVNGIYATAKARLNHCAPAN
jgi:hypothetical protein